MFYAGWIVRHVLRFVKVFCIYAEHDRAQGQGDQIDHGARDEGTPKPGEHTECRTLSNMLEVLILDYCRTLNLTNAEDKPANLLTKGTGTVITGIAQGDSVFVTEK